MISEKIVLHLNVFRKKNSNRISLLDLADYLKYSAVGLVFKKLARLVKDVAVLPEYFLIWQYLIAVFHTVVIGLLKETLGGFWFEDNNAVKAFADI